MKKKHKRKIRYSRIFIFLFCLIILFYLIYHNNITKDTEDADISEIIENEPIEDITIHLAAIGDIMCHSPNYKSAYNSTTSTYDFSPFFSEISKYTSNADITVGNLETTFAGSSIAYSGYPTFNSPSALGYAVKDIGVDVLCTANNHSLDKGYSGLSNTLNTLDEIGISHMGTYRSVDEQNSVLVKDVNGIKIAFLAFTYGTNGISIPSGKDYCINLIDKDLILEQINLAKKQDVDIICVNMHWGIEYQTSPNSEQKELANFLFENGVQIILGSHPHVLQSMETKEVTLSDGTVNNCFVIYSLGNFFSSQQDVGTKDSIILNLQITKNGADGTITINNVEYTPIYCNDNGDQIKKYLLIDLKSRLADSSTLSTSYYNTFTNALNRINKIYSK